MIRIECMASIRRDRNYTQRPGIFHHCLSYDTGKWIEIEVSINVNVMLLLG